MTLNQDEMGILWNAMTFTGSFDPMGNIQPRNFPLAQIADASSIVSRIMDYLKKGEEKLSEGDYELELSTKEKSLALECLNREWPAVNGKHILSLKEKLEK